MQITVTGIDRVRERIEKYADLQSKLLELAWRLCEVGSAVCDSVYHTSVSVYVEKTNEGAKVICEGEDVLFIEFGTGDKAGVLAANYDAVPPEVAPGTWSSGHAQMYSRYGFWYFGSRRYEYTEPHPATYEAYKAMIEELPQIADEVFAA